MLSVIVAIVILGAALYLVETFIPMAPPFKVLLRVVVVLVIVIYLLRLLGAAVPECCDLTCHPGRRSICRSATRRK